MGKYSHYNKYDWHDWLLGVTRSVVGQLSLQCRQKVAMVLNKAVVLASDECPSWAIENVSVGSYKVILGSAHERVQPAFADAFQRWLDDRAPADEQWVVRLFTEATFADLAKQAIAGQEGYTLTFDKAAHAEAMAQAHALANPHAGPSPAMAVASAPQWNTGLGFRFDASSSPDAFRKEYQGQWVAQGGTFRFAGRDYPYKSTSDENGARTFVSEMENERVDQLYAGPKVGMLVMDERTSVGVVEMLTATRAVMSTRRNAERVTLTFGIPKPAEKAPMFSQRRVTFDESGDTFVVPSKAAMAAQGKTHGNRYASREDVATKGQGLYVGVDAAVAKATEQAGRVVNEYLADAFPYPAYFNDRRVGVTAPRKSEPDPALVAKLNAEMSAVILGPTHELDRVVERESANVPVKCDPVRWGNVVRVTAARYTERHRKEREGNRDAQWWSSTAKVTAHEIEHVRPVIERYEAFRREGYSKVHSYQRALLKPGNETVATMRARDAYESAK